MKELFSFKGEMGRGAFWLVNIGIGVISMVVMFLCIFAGAYTGDTVFGPTNDPISPQTLSGAVIVVVYWLFEIVFMWVFLAALVKRLRDVGIALKWLVVFVPVFALYGAALSLFVPAGTTHPSLVGVIAVIVTGLPACLMMLWLFGSALFASGGKPRYFDPAQLPEGWKK